MSALPESLHLGFLVAASELGMLSAARLYVGEIASALGGAGIEAARDALGRDYPIFDAVATRWLERGSEPALDVRSLLHELEGARRVLVAGAEADALDALVPALTGTRVGIVVGGGGLEPDAARFAANFGGKLEIVPLTDWMRWAGARSALLTLVYGTDDDVAFVPQAHLRLVGPDVRTSFRSLVAWDLLGARPRLHPRFLAETSVGDFATVVRAVG